MQPPSISEIFPPRRVNIRVSHLRHSNVNKLLRGYRQLQQIIIWLCADYAHRLQAEQNVSERYECYRSA